MSDSRGLPLDMFRVCLFALLLIVLSRIHIHFGLGRFRPGLVLALAAAAMAVFNPRLLNTGKLLHSWQARTVAALGAWACLSAPFGLSLGASAVFILESYAKVVILFFLLVAAIRDERDLRFLMWAHVISCAVLAYYSIFVFSPRDVGGGFVRLGRLYTYDANDIGCILVSGIPIAMLLFQTSGPRGRLLAGWSLLGIGASAAISGSRGTFLGLVIVGGSLLVLARGVSAAKKLAFISVIATTLVVFAPPGYWNQMQTLLTPTEDYNWNVYYGRKQTAERAIGYMLRYPVFGLGIDNFNRAEGTISSRAVNVHERGGRPNRWRAAHNSFLEAGAELGIPGLVLWSGLIFGSIIGLRRLRRRLGRAPPAPDDPRAFVGLAASYLPVSLIGFAVTAFFLSFAWTELAYVLVAFAIGVRVCADRWLGPAPAASHARPSRASPRFPLPAGAPPHSGQRG